jgi:peptidoglycan/LPS O-acetylase OafA/YrhL
MINTNNKYRTDIDGLRAFAVIAVLLYHSGIPGFEGGFIGVDIFFVISGFLISNTLLKNIDNTEFFLKDFYIRRIRRIIPPLFVIKIFVITVGVCIYDSKTFEALGKSVISSSIFLSNVYFWRTTGYFESEVYKNPLIHTWSLSLEEQFYLLFPLFLILINKYFKTKLVTIIILLITSSFIINLFGVKYYPSATYYLLPTRVWELLIGTILSFKILPSSNNKIVKNTLFTIGISLLISSVNLINEHTMFPGYIVLLPILGVSIIIQNGINYTSSFQSILKTKIFIFIGKISYHLYLWHWPIISFYKYLKVTAWTNDDGFICILITLIMAYLTWRTIELPIKKCEYKKISKKYIALTICMILLLPILLGFLIVWYNGMPNRVKPKVTKIVNDASVDEHWEVQNIWEVNNSNGLFKTNPPIVGEPETSPSFALIGDSHARALIPAYAKLSQLKHLSGYMITMSSTPPIIGTTIISTVNDNGINEHRYNYSVLQFLKNNIQIKTVVLAARWGSYINGHWKEKKETPSYSIFYDNQNNKIENERGLELGTEAFIDSLIKLKKRIVILTSVPEIGYDVPSIYWSSSILPSLIDFNEIRPTKNEYHERENKANKILEKIANNKRLELIHIENVFYDHSNKAILMNKGKILYRDNNHLSKDGSIFLTNILYRSLNSKN